MGRNHGSIKRTRPEEDIPNQPAEEYGAKYAYEYVHILEPDPHRSAVGKPDHRYTCQHIRQNGQHSRYVWPDDRHTFDPTTSQAIHKSAQSARGDKQRKHTDANTKVMKWALALDQADAENNRDKHQSTATSHSRKNEQEQKQRSNNDRLQPLG